MRILLISFISLFLSTFIYSQAPFTQNPFKNKIGYNTTGEFLINYDDAAPVYTPTLPYDPIISIDTTADVIYLYDFSAASWTSIGGVSGTPHPDEEVVVGTGSGSTSYPEFVWDDESDRLLINNPTDPDLGEPGIGVQGTLDIQHVATTAGEHAIELDFDNAGFSGNAINIVQDVGALPEGSFNEAINVSFDVSDAVNGDVAGLRITSLGSTAATEIWGLNTGPRVNPILQRSGIEGDMDEVDNNGSNDLVAFTSTGTDVTIFAADNDYVIIGDAAQFTEISFLLETVASNPGIKPTFEFSTGSGTWSTFSPTDGTSGFTSSGEISWSLSSVPTWAVGTSGNYLIRITRTQNSLSTVPIEDLVQITLSTLYSWDLDGKVTIESADIDGSVGGVYPLDVAGVADGNGRHEIARFTDGSQTLVIEEHGSGSAIMYIDAQGGNLSILSKSWDINAGTGGDPQIVLGDAATDFGVIAAAGGSGARIEFEGGSNGGELEFNDNTIVDQSGNMGVNGFQRNGGLSITATLDVNGSIRMRPTASIAGESGESYYDSDDDEYWDFNATVFERRVHDDGTHLDNEIAVYNANGDIEGDPNFTYNGSILKVNTTLDPWTSGLQVDHTTTLSGFQMGTASTTTTNMSLYNALQSHSAVYGEMYDGNDVKQGTLQALYGYIQSNSTGGADLLIGGLGEVDVAAASGTVSVARGLTGLVYNSGAGAVTTMTGLYLSATETGTGSVGTANVIYLEDISGNVTTSNAIFQAGADDLNVFKGPMDLDNYIDMASISAPIQVQGRMYHNSGTLFFGDGTDFDAVLVDDDLEFGAELIPFGTGTGLTTNANFVFETGSVELGVGTPNPQAPVHIVGDDGAVPLFPTIGSNDWLVIEDNGNTNVSLISGAGSVGVIKWFENASSSDEARIGMDHTTDQFYISRGGHNQGIVVQSDNDVIIERGNVGINEATPLNLLHVVFNNVASNPTYGTADLIIIENGTGNANLAITADNNANGEIRFYADGTANYKGAVSFDHAENELRLNTSNVTNGTLGVSLEDDDDLIVNAGDLYVGATDSKLVVGSTVAPTYTVEIIQGTDFGGAAKTAGLLMQGDRSGNGQPIAAIDFENIDVTTYTAAGIRAYNEINGGFGDDDVALKFYVTDNTTSSVALLLDADGSIHLPTLGSGTFTGTEAYNILVTSAGDVVEEVYGTIGSMDFDEDQVVGPSEDNFVLTYDDASGEISLEANSGIPGGLNTEIQYNNNGSFGGTAELTYANATGLVTYAPTLDEATGDEVGLNITPTVNKATSGNYVAVNINVTETAAPGTENELIKATVGGTDVFAVRPEGRISIGHSEGGGDISIHSYGAQDQNDTIFVAHDNGGTLRTFLKSKGTQLWRMRSGAGVESRLIYDTPADAPGIVFREGSSGTSQPRTDFREFSGGGIAIGVHTTGGAPGTDFIFHPAGRFQIETAGGYITLPSTTSTPGTSGDLYRNGVNLQFHDGITANVVLDDRDLSNDQIAVTNLSGRVEGDANFTYNGTSLLVGTSSNDWSAGLEVDRTTSLAAFQPAIHAKATSNRTSYSVNQYHIGLYGEALTSNNNQQASFAGVYGYGGPTSTGGVDFVAGVVADAFINASSGTYIDNYGLYSTASITNAAATSMIGGYFGVFETGTGSIQDAWVLYVDDATGNITGTIYGVYQAGSDDDNYFAGNMKVGGSAAVPAATVDVDGSLRLIGQSTVTTSAGEMFFDSDDNELKLHDGAEDQYVMHDESSLTVHSADGADQSPTEDDLIKNMYAVYHFIQNSGVPASHSILTLPTPSTDLSNVRVVVVGEDDDATFDIQVTAGTNNIWEQGTATTTITVANHETVEFHIFYDGTNYLWVITNRY